MSHSLPWFRFYDEALDDAKVQRLGGQSFKLWINMLCLANRGVPRGFIKGPVQDIAFSLRLDVSDAASCIQELVDAELLVKVSTPVGDGWEPWNWHGRQFQSDDKRQYWQAYEDRERKKKADIVPNIGAAPGPISVPISTPISEISKPDIRSDIGSDIRSDIPDTDIDSDKDKDSDSDEDRSVDDFDRMLSGPLPESLAEAKSVMSLPRKEKKKVREEDEGFEWFWEHYPRDKEGIRPGTKAAALREWKHLTDEEQGQIGVALEGYRNTRKVRDGFVWAAQRFLADSQWKQFIPSYTKPITRDDLASRNGDLHPNGTAEHKPMKECDFEGCDNETYHRYCQEHGVFPRFEELKPEYSESIPEEEEEMF